MKILPRISETEWEVMRVLWTTSPLSGTEVLNALLKQDDSWHPKTARTLLARLVRKGALKHAKEGRAYYYRPAVSEAECVAEVTDSFVERVFGGALQPMLAHFVRRKKLNSKELRELRAILNEQQGKEKKP